MPADDPDGYGLDLGLLAGPSTDTDVASLGLLGIGQGQRPGDGLGSSSPQSGRRTHIDPWEQLQAQRNLNPRPEFAPFANGIRVLYRGGNPFPQQQSERAAAEQISETALAANLTDAISNSAFMRKRRQQQQMEQLRAMSPEEREMAMTYALLQGALGGGGSE